VVVVDDKLQYDLYTLVVFHGIHRRKEKTQNIQNDVSSTRIQQFSRR
jgi:hypothetical protein